jgi:UDP-N-acetylmuramoyl-tripeptide--D-alanyl-D-alanine ligase
MTLVTSIGPEHLELVGTLEDVARANAEAIDALPTGGIAVVPADEPLLEPYLRRADIEIRRFGRVEEPGVFDLGDRIVHVRTSYTSRHQLQNTLAALIVCDVLGVPVAAELTVEFTALREQVLVFPNGIELINDCYNANPISMRAALVHLAERAGGRRQVAVLGEMAELGAGAVGYHREVGAAAAELGVSELVAVGPLAREYAAGANGVQTRWVATAEEAAAALRELLRPGDVVLVKGSRAVGLEVVAANLQS